MKKGLDYDNTPSEDEDEVKGISPVHFTFSPSDLRRLQAQPRHTDEGETSEADSDAQTEEAKS